MSLETDDYRIEETVWIPVAGGRNLAGRLFLPRDAEQKPVPCILEYLPYRRRDGTRLRDDGKFRWFAANGYAAIRVDIAGTGDSDGFVEDEYVAREQDDAVEVIEWLARRPWCSGAVGMMGISWGGFNALQVAARRPEALKAIVTTCSTDDRYACDAHYMGGCLLNDNFGWGGSFFGYGARPPDPAVVGNDRWRTIWKQRIDDLQLYPAVWLRHQRRDDYWKQGSVCEDYSAINCAVLAVGGWLDGYTAPIFSLLSGLSSPCKAIVGPWGHKEPHQGVPGPAMDFLGECKRWWDRWLKDVPNGADEVPALRAYVMDHADPLPHFVFRPGKWVAFDNWPDAAITPQLFHLGLGALSRDPLATIAPLSIRSPQTTGMRAQEWCPYGQGRIAAEGAGDQREDDGGSLVFDTAPLASDLSILGTVTAQLRIAADQPQALVAVRLCAVAPDGGSAPLCFGVLNLSHRNSHEFPEALVRGTFYDVEVELKPVGQTVPAGHRLRLAISSAYWPMVWPGPHDATLAIDPAASTVSIPVIAELGSLQTPVFQPAVAAAPGPTTRHSSGVERRTVITDVESETVTYDILSDDGDYTLDEIGTRITSTRHKTYQISRSDPLATMTRVASTLSYQRDDWDIRLETSIECRVDATHFHVAGEIRAFDGGAEFCSRRLTETIPRDHM